MGLKASWCFHCARELLDPPASSLVLRAGACGSTRPIPCLADLVPVGMGVGTCLFPGFLPHRGRDVAGEASGTLTSVAGSLLTSFQHSQICCHWPGLTLHPLAISPAVRKCPVRWAGHGLRSCCMVSDPGAATF